MRRFIGNVAAKNVYDHQAQRFTLKASTHLYTFPANHWRCSRIRWLKQRDSPENKIAALPFWSYEADNSEELQCSTNLNVSSATLRTEAHMEESSFRLRHAKTNHSIEKLFLIVVCVIVREKKQIDGSIEVCIEIYWLPSSVCAPHRLTTVRHNE